MKLSKRILSIILALVTVVTMCVGMNFTAQAAPSKPASLKATSTSSSTIKLTWKKSSGATGYYIYRSTSKTKGYKKVATIKKASTVSYTNKKLSANKTYYYKVRAYKGKKVGSFSAIASAKTKSPWGTIKNFKVTYYRIDDAVPGFLMKWSYISNATGYEVKLYKDRYNEVLTYRPGYNTNQLAIIYPKYCEKVVIRAYKKNSDGTRKYGPSKTYKFNFNYSGNEIAVNEDKWFEIAEQGMYNGLFDLYVI